MIPENLIGVVHGRFQPFHLGHFSYVMAAKELCDFLYIGIANPDPSLTSSHKTNTERSKVISNPFTYYERLAMIKKSLLNANFKENEFEIVPFPINFPQYIKYYVPVDAVFFITIYDDWGYAKKEMLEKENFKVKVLNDLKIAEGTKIREMMRKNDKWTELVPKAVAEYITNNKLIENKILKSFENE